MPPIHSQGFSKILIIIPKEKEITHPTKAAIFRKKFFLPPGEIVVGKETMQYPRKHQAAKFAMSLGSISCPHEMKEKTQSSN